METWKAERIDAAEFFWWCGWSEYLEVHLWDDIHQQLRINSSESKSGTMLPVLDPSSWYMTNSKQALLKWVMETPPSSKMRQVEKTSPMWKHSKRNWNADDLSLLWSPGPQSLGRFWKTSFNFSCDDTVHNNSQTMSQTMSPTKL